MKSFTLQRLAYALTFPVFLFALSCVFSQQPKEGYQIDFTVLGLEDSMVRLGFYEKGRTYVKDSIQIAADGTFSFQGEQVLDHGFYFLLLDTTLLFEFIVGKDQHFSVSTDTADYVENIQFSGSRENEVFLESLKMNAKSHKDMQPHIEVTKDAASVKKARKMAKKEIERIREELEEYRAKVVADNESPSLTALIQANMEVTVPEEISKKGMKARYEYLQEHYFDNFSLSNPLTTRLPKGYFKDKVTYYLDSLTVPQPEESIAAVERLVALTEENEEAYHRLIYLCTRKYQKPAFMGLDEVLVHIYDKHYATGKMDAWANEKLKKNIKEQVDKLRKSLIGDTAEEIILRDISGKPTSLYGMGGKYRVIYFFDPDCSACAVETPKMVTFLDNTKYDVSFYAVSLDEDMKKTTEYAEKNVMVGENVRVVGAYESYRGNVFELYDAFSTPTTYIIDRANKIIAKKIPATNIDQFLAKHEIRLLKEAQEKE